MTYVRIHQSTNSISIKDCVQSKDGPNAYGYNQGYL
jgi:hypothetical protein